MESFSADGSCCPCPGKMEYRFVDNQTKEIIVSESFPFGTNNVAEFLGLVAAIRHVQENQLNKIVYSDSITALGWVLGKRCGTTMKECEETIPVRTKIDEALAWLNSNEIVVDVRKWDTARWGEVPADYDRK
jgi:ribonuclease HI